MNAKDKVLLESILDRNAIRPLILALAEICEEKANHVSENWGDAPGIVRAWRKNAEVLERTVKKIALTY